LGVVRGRYVNTLRTKGCCVNNATLHFICSARGRQCLLDSSLRSSLLIFAREIMRVVMFSTVAEYWAGGRGGVVVVKDGSVVIPSHISTLFGCEARGLVACSSPFLGSIPG